MMTEKHGFLCLTEDRSSLPSTDRQPSADSEQIGPLDQQQNALQAGSLPPSSFTGAPTFGDPNTVPLNKVTEEAIFGLVNQATQELRDTVSDLQSELAAVKLELHNTKAMVAEERRVRLDPAMPHVFDNYDLLEDILLRLPMRQVVRCESVNKFFFDVIRSSSRLQKHLWRVYMPTDDHFSGVVANFLCYGKRQYHGDRWEQTDFEAPTPLFSFSDTDGREPNFQYSLKSRKDCLQLKQQAHQSSLMSMYALRNAPSCELIVNFEIPICETHDSTRQDKHNHYNTGHKSVSAMVRGDLTFGQMQRIAAHVAFYDIEFGLHPLRYHAIVGPSKYGSGLHRDVKKHLQEFELAMMEADRRESEMRVIGDAREAHRLALQQEKKR